MITFANSWYREYRLKAMQTAYMIDLHNKQEFEVVYSFLQVVGYCLKMNEIHNSNKSQWTKFLVY